MLSCTRSLCYDQTLMIASFTPLVSFCISYFSFPWFMSAHFFIHNINDKPSTNKTIMNCSDYSENGLYLENTWTLFTFRTNWINMPSFSWKHTQAGEIKLASTRASISIAKWNRSERNCELSRMLQKRQMPNLSAETSTNSRQWKNSEKNSLMKL